MGYSVETREAAGAEAEAAVKRGLAADNRARLAAAGAPPDIDVPRGLAAIARADDTRAVVGGLLGELDWGWLYVRHLWVEEAWRRCGVGSALLAAAEAAARARGIDGAYLHTSDFQAPGFYRRHGYVEFGRLADFPPGFTLYFLKKEGLG